MSKTVRHHIVGDKTACGRSRWGVYSTSVKEHVTCGRCLASKAYKEAGPTLAQVIESLGRALNEWAEENGVCSDYDDAIEVAQAALDPFGLTWPSRKKEWHIDINTSYVEGCATEDEVFEKIAANPQDYIYIRGN
jgi:hypothetical protein